uniref:Uncharacterized protein n=1 Tax=Pavo cristatus TaxID=9049 RepID=A0A8C9F3G3_PAVCR
GAHCWPYCCSTLQAQLLGWGLIVAGSSEAPSSTAPSAHTRLLSAFQQGEIKCILALGEEERFLVFFFHRCERRETKITVITLEP